MPTVLNNSGVQDFFNYFFIIFIYIFIMSMIFIIIIILIIIILLLLLLLLLFSSYYYYCYYYYLLSFLAMGLYIISDVPWCLRWQPCNQCDDISFHFCDPSINHYTFWNACNTNMYTSAFCCSFYQHRFSGNQFISWTSNIHINTLRLRQNVRHFAGDIFKCIFLNENVLILIQDWLKFVPKGPIDNILALF